VAFFTFFFQRQENSGLQALVVPNRHSLRYIYLLSDIHGFNLHADVLPHSRMYDQSKSNIALLYPKSHPLKRNTLWLSREDPQARRIPDARY
jgi:hypothetical protein